MKFIYYLFFLFVTILSLWFICYNFAFYIYANSGIANVKIIGASFFYTKYTGTIPYLLGPNILIHLADLLEQHQYIAYLTYFVTIMLTFSFSYFNFYFVKNLKKFMDLYFTLSYLIATLIGYFYVKISFILVLIRFNMSANTNQNFYIFVTLFVNLLGVIAIGLIFGFYFYWLKALKQNDLPSANFQKNRG